MLEGIIRSKSKTFFIFCFCFLAGVGLISIFDFKIKFLYVYIGLFVFVTFLIVTWQQPKNRFLALCLLVGFFGIVRYQFSFPSDTPDHIQTYADKKVQLTGYVAVEPDVRIDGARYIVEVTSLAKSEEVKNVKGRVYLKQELYPRFEYGDKLKLTCTLLTPEPIEGKTEVDRTFRYDRYLARYGVFSICEKPRAEKIGEGEGSQIFAAILEIKNAVAQKVSLLWHEPQASFMAGLLYGYRGGLGTLNELFSRTGVTHIVAISGFNITVIATILITICVQLCIRRQLAFWLITFGIILFVLFAGASASVVRAGIMGIIVLLAKQTGRLSRVGNVLILVAVIMVLQNPFVLLWDAGFQLSFLSTLGLVYLSVPIGKIFSQAPELWGMRETLVSTLAAIVATLPLILFQFGRLSIVAPIVNILILWLIPWLMLFGTAAVFFSFIFFPLGQIVAWISWVGLQYIIEVVKWFASLRFAMIDLRISVWVMILLYCGIIYFVYRIEHRVQRSVFY